MHVQKYVRGYSSILSIEATKKITFLLNQPNTKLKKKHMRSPQNIYYQLLKTRLTWQEKEHGN